MEEKETKYTETKEKESRYPQNLYLKQKIKDAGKTVKGVAKNIGYPRQTVSDCVNGHYLGSKLVPLIEQDLSK